MSDDIRDNKDKTRILGHTARMGVDAAVEVWAPPSQQEIDALPPLPRRPARGWKLSRDDGPQEPAPQMLHHEPEDAVTEEEEIPSPAPKSAAPAPPPSEMRPTGIEEGSVQAMIWERPGDAAKMVRTMVMEGNTAPDGEGDQSPIEEAAILFIGLGQELSSEVFKHFSDYEIEEITQAISYMKNVATEKRDAIMEDFKRHMQAGEWFLHGGIDYARQILERAVGPRKSSEILNRVITRVSSGFYMLKNVAPDQIAPFISHEHPQTVALILSQLDSAQAAGILSQLPERMQSDVAYRITTMENITPNVIKQIEESLEQSLRDILSGDQDVGGPKVVADMLNMTGSSVEKNVLDQMDGQDPEVAEAVRNLMFVFEDIAKLTDRDLQKLLDEIDKEDNLRRSLSISLKAAQKQTKDKLFGKMSEGMRQTVEQEMVELGPMRLADVEEAQLRVVQQVRALEEKGEVTIVRGASTDDFVD